MMISIDDHYGLITSAMNLAPFFLKSESELNYWLWRLDYFLIRKEIYLLQKCIGGVYDQLNIYVPKKKKRNKEGVHYSYYYELWL